MLTVTTQATDRSLLTLAELRSAVGVSDGSHDAKLIALGGRLESTIANACRVASDGITPPTFRLETLTETFRLEDNRKQLLLSRRPIVSVTSVVENGEDILAANYEIDAGGGLLSKLSSDYPTCWSFGKIVVAYSAGWATVPDDLKLAASKLAGVLWSEGERVDPTLRSESIPGVIDRAWWVGPTDDPLIPEEIRQLLAPYMNYWIS